MSTLAEFAGGSGGSPPGQTLRHLTSGGRTNDRSG
jgi:hypothetical protein